MPSCPPVSSLPWTSSPAPRRRTMRWSQANFGARRVRGRSPKLFRVVVVQLELAVLVKDEPRADPALALGRLTLACLEEDDRRLARVARRIGDRLVRRGSARREVAHLPRLVAGLGQVDHH